MTRARLTVWLTALGGGLALLVTGCGGDSGPKTYPVKGKVVVKNGDVRMLVGGFVHLELVSNPKVKALGEIEESGEFSVGTFINEKPRPRRPGGRIPGLD